MGNFSENFRSTFLVPRIRRSQFRCHSLFISPFPFIVKLDDMGFWDGLPFYHRRKLGLLSFHNGTCTLLLQIILCCHTDTQYSQTSFVYQCQGVISSILKWTEYICWSFVFEGSLQVTFTNIQWSKNVNISLMSFDLGKKKQQHELSNQQ